MNINETQFFKCLTVTSVTLIVLWCNVNNIFLYFFSNGKSIEKSLNYVIKIKLNIGIAKLL